MTKVNKINVKCAVCGNESEQICVYSVNYLMGSREDNDKLINSKQKCPKCGYESNDISKIDFLYKENEYLKVSIPSYWKEYSSRNIGHPIFKFNPIGTNEVKVMFKFYDMVKFSPTTYGMYTVEKLGTGTQEIYDKEFNKIVESIKNEGNLYNILRLTNVQIDDKSIKRIYIEYLNSKTVSIMDLVLVNNQIFMFNCPLCNSADINVVLENRLIKIENTIIKSIVIKNSKQEILDKIDKKIEKIQNDEKKELLNKKIEESKHLIGYSKGSLKPDNTIFTSIILVDDLIYKAVDRKVEYLENQKDKIDKVWDYVNCMQGNIRSEAERIKQLPHIKDTAKDEITFKINDEMFTLTSKITDEEGINFYNKVVNDILELIK